MTYAGVEYAGGWFAGTRAFDPGVAGGRSGTYFWAYDWPYFTGKAVSSDVPGLFPVALNARPYLVDFKSELFRRKTIDRLRNQSDTSDQVGEHSLNVDDLWRRSTSDWSHGGGQTYYDRTGSDQLRFNTSKGIDPWTRWQLSLLRDTAAKRSSSNTNLRIVVAGTRLYLIDGTDLLYSTTSTTVDDFAAVTGGPGVSAMSVASDGARVYVAYGASGVFVTNTSSGSFVGGETVTGTVNLVAHVKGRLMAAAGNVLYNITTLGAALPAVEGAGKWTNSNSNMTYVSITEGSGFIYIAGYTGDKSLVYKQAIRPDGTALDIPTVATELPDGEIVYAVQGYLGYVLIGTNKGVRFATADGNGNLTYGQLILTTSAVRAFEPQDRFVWFGWENYDGTSTGLGRADLSVFVAPLTPASASDLMASGQGQVASIVTFGANYDLRAFTVAGLGVFIETTTKVTSGEITSGQITYGIADQKTAIAYNLRTKPLAGSVQASISTDESSYQIIGTMNNAGDTVFDVQVGERVGERFQLKETLTRSSTDTTTGPTLTRHTLRAYPSPLRGDVFTVPLLLHEQILVENIPKPLDPRVELEALISMVNSHRPVVYQEGEQSFSVFVDGVDWRPHHRTKDGTFFNGLAVVTLKSVAQE